MKDDQIKAYAVRPPERDAIEVYVIRYRKAVVKFASGGEAEEWTQDFAQLSPDGFEWVTFAPMSHALPLVQVSELYAAKNPDDQMVEKIAEWAASSPERSQELRIG